LREKETVNHTYFFLHWLIVEHSAFTKVGSCFGFMFVSYNNKIGNQIKNVSIIEFRLIKGKDGTAKATSSVFATEGTIHNWVIPTSADLPFALADPTL